MNSIRFDMFYDYFYVFSKLNELSFILFTNLFKKKNVCVYILRVDK